MKNMTDTEYLLQQQYRDPSKLEARVALHIRFSENIQGMTRWWLEQLQLPEGARILEVGCGPGGYWNDVAGLIPSSWELTVTDFSPGMVAVARERLAALGRPVTVLQADVQDLPFEDESFDAVVANFMLYHVPDLPGGLSQIHRVLVPSGKLFALTNGARHMAEYRALVHRLAPGTARSEDLGFSLENGAAQLAPFFDPVRLVRYPDELAVTEVEPLLAYMRSQLNDLAPEKEAAVRQQIEAEIASKGSIHITKDSGLFIGVKR